MESTAYYKYLLSRYYNGTATPAETEELMEELRKNADEEQWQELVRGIYMSETADPHYLPQDYELVLQRILDTPVVMPVTITRRLWLRRIAAAAAVLLLLGTGTYLWRAHSGRRPGPIAVQQIDVKPGREGAVLTLADGTQVDLDSLQNDTVTNQQGATVILHNGQLAYQQNGQGTSYNTMSTPKGRKFRLQLPDGTHVWINAASSLRFPTAFTKGDRTVELSGEAYFEVAPLPKQPFKVKLDDGTFIQVLGTDFNVNAYKEEHLISTTLLRGAVKISRKNIQQVLKPGQQMQLVQDSEAFTIVNKVDTSAVMAWKNGFLSFQDKKLTEVMHMLERWYGIEVIYQGIPPDIVFYGEIGSDVNLSGVLKFLEDSGVKFSMEKNQLTVAAKQ
ncbi:FecR family protein [Chitinophaga sp. Cy-1792]|uniref:FecR family protein n=1 Tax=Chitinophaga sp. Cy-1792 TaxID=2608339 RepID=UPI00141F234A|nr:DUF4974 domain-containing protein [Chitinophaga sp. Cy-1792]